MYIMSNPSLGHLVAQCLIGGDAVPAELGGADLSKPEDIAQILNDAGWGAAQIRQIRDQRMAEGHPWPRLVPADQRGSIGAAQLMSASKAVVELLGLGAEVKLRDGSSPLSAHDIDLIRQAPPHHGNVG